MANDKKQEEPRAQGGPENEAASPLRYPHPVAVLAEGEGPYERGRSVTTDREAPRLGDEAPRFAADSERVKAWIAVGRPVFVDAVRFAAWRAAGKFAPAREGGDGGNRGVTARKEATGG